MKGKLLNIFLILTSFIGYLEWGGGNNMWLIQGEVKIFSQLFTNPTSVIHPFIVLPLIGQLLLLFTLFQKKVSKVVTYIGIIGIGILFLFILIIGIMGLNYGITLSTFPFLITSVLTIKFHQNKSIHIFKGK